MSLLEDLRKVAATSLNGSELPTHVEVQDLFGALIKTLDAAGVTVAKDLLPAPVAAVADTVITAAAPVEQSGVDDVLAAAQAEIDRLKAELERASAPAPAAPVAETAPVAPPIQGAN
ncbi:MAG TPA: hypothetical protein VFN75_11595 [Pseudonocardiaceae bacterium]|nr:hypothetical protein [Pseudonocardiaceae bacterium]